MADSTPKKNSSPQRPADAHGTPQSQRPDVANKKNEK